MTEQEILDIITSDRLPKFNGDAIEVTWQLAKRLAAISHKISQQDLHELIGVGIVLHQLSSVELNALNETKALMKSLQNTQHK